jgi:hypothetical protein
MSAMAWAASWLCGPVGVGRVLPMLGLDLVFRTPLVVVGGGIELSREFVESEVSGPQLLVFLPDHLEGVSNRASSNGWMAGERRHSRYRCPKIWSYGNGSGLNSG